jgi:formate dehydrogenase major subunit
MNIEVSRRHFMKLAGAGAAGSAIAAFGFGEAEAQAAAHVRPFKLALALTKEARTICPYCAVSCGMVVFASPNKANGGKLEVTHIEGDSDHPTNRGTLCPKGAAAIDYIRSQTRVKQPMVRKPGTNKFEPISWDAAMDRIAKLMKEDRDANWIEKNKDGVTVNRWTSMAFLSGSSCTNETGWITWKVTRGLGMLQLENQARI